MKPFAPSPSAWALAVPAQSTQSPTLITPCWHGMNAPTVHIHAYAARLSHSSTSMPRDAVCVSRAVPKSRRQVTGASKRAHSMRGRAPCAWSRAICGHGAGCDTAWQDASLVSCWRRRACCVDGARLKAVAACGNWRKQNTDLAWESERTTVCFSLALPS